jgi:hypothetical protein
MIFAADREHTRIAASAELTQRPIAPAIKADGSIKVDNVIRVVTREKTARSAASALYAERAAFNRAASRSVAVSRARRQP